MKTTCLERIEESWPSTHLVHEGLREGGLVDLIVPVLAVAEEVDDDVGLPLAAPLGRQLGRAHHSLHIVAIHVEDGAVEGLGNVCAVRRGAALFGVGGESNLRVGKDVGTKSIIHMRMRPGPHRVESRTGYRL